MFGGTGLDKTLLADDLDETPAHVPESRFGLWFLGTRTWTVHVLARAINDLDRLIKNRNQSYPVIVDIGCGYGRSFRLLRRRFGARRLIGVDIDERMLVASAIEAARHKLTVDLMHGSSSRLSLPDRSVDMVFCHQTLHHLVDQENALLEFHRVLRPGGLLLLAESTRAYINSWLIRLLFRHPKQVQRTAAQYLRMVREAGFVVDAEAISYPYLWWSRPDLGLMERWFGVVPPATHEETLINLVAIRPAGP